MQHVFKFQMKHENEETPIESAYVTKSSRLGKVADFILRDVNALRAKSELPEWYKESLEYFRIAQLR